MLGVSYGPSQEVTGEESHITLRKLGRASLGLIYGTPSMHRANLRRFNVGSVCRDEF